MDGRRSHQNVRVEPIMLVMCLSHEVDAEVTRGTPVAVIIAMIRHC